VVALPETAPVPQQPLLQPADNTTNMQLSYKLPSYNTYLANLLASFKLQEFKVSTQPCPADIHLVFPTW
jgi:hypothetical protein